MGAVRIVNGRLLSDEVFEELVNPGRDIPVASYRIHGIHQEMVAEKDPIETVLPRFRQFVSDTVLVGHNIAFDMKLLKLKENATRIRFTNPVLDTLLLSAVLHPMYEQHDMESIAQRLGISIVGRHTALGDALTTAEIFFKTNPDIEQQRHSDSGGCHPCFGKILLCPIKILIPQSTHDTAQI